MDTLSFVHLSDIEENQIIELMNNQKVGEQLPLLSNSFSVENCRDFLKEKQKIWDTHGYGPWAFLINGKFAGWGGLQPEHGDADFALVLHPKYWGWGKKIFDKIRDQAFGGFGLDSITILFPPSRLNSKAISRLGFVEDGELNVKGENFIRYRLFKNKQV